VYAGIDPVTQRRHYLREIVASGPTAENQAQAVCARLVAEVAERRNPRTSATIDQLLERYLDQFDGSPNTMTLYRAYVRNHISPLLGSTKVGALDAELLDSFYAELRRCRKHCTKRRGVTDHRTEGDHDCDARCVPHRCKPLGATTVRHMHFILSGAYKKAVRWRWVAVSPIAQGEPPAAPKENPSPPSPAEAARIVTAAYRDPDWGTQLWVAMTTGARRGEVCAIRWPAVNLDEGRETIWLRHGIRKDGRGGWEEATLKTHQQRRIALDSETVAALVEHRERCEQRAAALGVALHADAFVFSDAPDGSTFTVPDTVSQRYERLARRLDITTTLHKLRHYSATELILAGVDVRTVAGRLGHAGGGTTTLRTYTAWVSEADQRAAAGWTTRMPARAQLQQSQSWASENPQHPYERIAADLARRIEAGELAAGDPAPTAAVLAAEHGASLATARRAVALAKEWGVLVSDGAGRPRIARPEAAAPAEPTPAPAPTDARAAGQYWSVVVTGPGGTRFPPRVVKADIVDPDSFRPHLVGIVVAEAPEIVNVPEQEWIGDYELHVSPPGSAEIQAIFRLG
jgi:integrase